MTAVPPSQGKNRRCFTAFACSSRRGGEGSFSYDVVQYVESTCQIFCMTDRSFTGRVAHNCVRLAIVGIPVLCYAPPRPRRKQPEIADRVAVSVGNVVGEGHNEVLDAVRGLNPLLHFEILSHETDLSSFDLRKPMLSDGRASDIPASVADELVLRCKAQ
jgi:hypothetical protein